MGQIYGQFLCDCGRWSEFQCDSQITEGLEAKPEQMQPVVQPQDAALDTDEPSVQPAGDPDAWAEEFEAWLMEEYEKAKDLERRHRGSQSIVVRNMLRTVLKKWKKQRSIGAA